MSLPNSASVAEQLATFEQELSSAPTPRDAQAVRDRFLGRKNSVVASWMQLIATAPVDQKKLIGRYANERNSRSKHAGPRIRTPPRPMRALPAPWT